MNTKKMPSHATKKHSPVEPSEKESPSKKFSFSQPIQQAVTELGYTEWTPIQEMAIPLMLEGKDVIGQSHTGSGKTTAFGLPIIERLQPSNKAQALIMVPTRELAEQVAQQMKKFAKHKRVRVTPVYGGVGMGGQIAHLRQTDIVVGTPGRILDHLDRGTLNLSGINTLVLDEADRMLDMGFIRDMKKIIMKTPKERQTVLFSATLSREINDIAQQYMRHPVEVKAQSHVDKGKLEQGYYDLDKRGDQKFGLLMHVLQTEKPSLAIIFAGTRRMVDKVERNLNQNGIPAQAIHGGLSQNQRKRTLDDFHGGHFHVLVASDIAARGLDIKNVSHIINYDIPRTPSEYIHRSGRTARAGMEGKIISILAPQDYDYFRSIMRDKSHAIVEWPVPEFTPMSFVNKKGAPETNRSFQRNPTSPRAHFSRGSRSNTGGKSFSPRRREERDSRPYGDKPRAGNGRSFGTRKTSEEKTVIHKRFSLNSAPRDERPTRDPNWVKKKKSKNKPYRK